MFMNPFNIPFSIAETLITTNELKLTQRWFYRPDHALEANSIPFTDFFQFQYYNNISWFDFNEPVVYLVPSHRDIVVLYRGGK